MHDGSQSRADARRALIVGGGLGGLAAALALRSAGIEAVVYGAQTKAAFQAGGGYTIWYAGIRALPGFGLAEKGPRRRPAPRAVRVHHTDGTATGLVPDWRARPAARVAARRYSPHGASRDPARGRRGAGDPPRLAFRRVRAERRGGDRPLRRRPGGAWRSTRRGGRSRLGGARAARVGPRRRHGTRATATGSASRRPNEGWCRHRRSGSCSTAATASACCRSARADSAGGAPGRRPRAGAASSPASRPSCSGSTATGHRR